MRRGMVGMTKIYLYLHSVAHRSTLLLPLPLLLLLLLLLLPLPLLLPLLLLLTIFLTTVFPMYLSIKGVVV